MKKTTRWLKQALCLDDHAGDGGLGHRRRIPASSSAPGGLLAGSFRVCLWSTSSPPTPRKGWPIGDGARVFLKAGAECYWMSFAYDRKSKDGMPIWDQATAAEFRKRYGSVEDYWIEHFPAKRAIQIPGGIASATAYKVEATGKRSRA